MRMIIVTMILLSSFISLSQKLEKEKEFVSICKSILNIKEIQDTSLLTYYEGKKSIFFMGNTKYIEDYDSKINISGVNGVELLIWFKKDLFFYNIPFWFELTEISYTAKSIEVKFKSFNSVNNQFSKPLIDGVVVLRQQDDEDYVIINKKIQINPRQTPRIK